MKRINEETGKLRTGENKEKKKEEMEMKVIKKGNKKKNGPKKH